MKLRLLTLTTWQEIQALTMNSEMKEIDPITLFASNQDHATKTFIIIGRYEGKCAWWIKEAKEVKVTKNKIEAKDQDDNTLILAEKNEDLGKTWINPRWHLFEQ